ncbi:MAG TPA: hypothetical protein VIJ25_07165, partial [Methylococcales bacterium]
EVVAALGEAKRIATFGLGGCTAVAVASEFPDGSRRAYLQHYSPVEKLASAQALEKALTPTGINEPSKTQVVIVSPCNYAKDTTGKFVLKPTSFLLINLLESTSLHYLGAEADVQVHSYWVGEESNLAIELGATGETNIVVESLFD